jgi:hypothetical protein
MMQCRLHRARSFVLPVTTKLLLTMGRVYVHFLVRRLLLSGLTPPSQFAKEAPAVMHAFLSHGDTCTNIETKAMQIANRGLSEYDDDGPNKEQAVADEDVNVEAKMNAKFEKLTKTFEDIMQNIGGLCSSDCYSSYLQLLLDTLLEQGSKIRESVLRLTGEGSSGEPIFRLENGAVKLDRLSEEHSTPVPSPDIHIKAMFSTCIPLLDARTDNLNMAKQLLTATVDNARLEVMMSGLDMDDEDDVIEEVDAECDSGEAP